MSNGLWKLKKRAWFKTLLEQDLNCFYCDIPLDKNCKNNHSGNELSVDHIKTSSDGGKSTKENLLICCTFCNVLRDKTDHKIFKNFIESYVKPTRARYNMSYVKKFMPMKYSFIQKNLLTEHKT